MNLLRRLTFLLRPNWVILFLVVVAFAYLCFTVLAPWQLGKNISTSHRNNLIASSVQADPVSVTTMLGKSSTKDTEWRRVTADGSYVPGSTVLQRLQRLNDKPAYGVLAEFRLDDGRVLLVDRGLVGAADGSHLPSIAEPPSGRRHIEGRVRQSEGTIPGKQPTMIDGYRQVYSIDTPQLSTVLRTPLTTIPTGHAPGYLQLSGNQPGAFTPEDLPQLDAGPYLSYGLQWIAFGVMAPLGLGYFIYAEISERRRERAAPPADSVAGAPPPDEPVPAATSSARSTGAGTTTTDSPPATAPVHTKTQTNADRLADRYGGARR